MQHYFVALFAWVMLGACTRYPPALGGIILLVRGQEVLPGSGLIRSGWLLFQKGRVVWDLLLSIQFVILRRLYGEAWGGFACWLL